MQEEFFGQPQGLLQLASNLSQASERLWQLQETLEGRVAGLVPSSWEGPAAASFRKHWDGRRTDIRAAAEMARRMNSAIATLGAELGAAKAEFVAAERIAQANGMQMTVSAAGCQVSPPPHPAQHALRTSLQITGNWAYQKAMTAWSTAHSKLWLESREILGGLGKDILLIPVISLDHLGNLAVGLNDFFARVESLDGSGAWTDVKNAASGAWQGVRVLASGAASAAEWLGRWQPEAYPTHEEYWKAVKELSEQERKFIEGVLDRPGPAITGTGVVALDLFGPGWALKALRAGATGAELAAIERELAAAEALANSTRTGWIQRGGQALEAADMRLMAQQGERAADLNSLPYQGRGGTGSFPGWDAWSERGIYSDKAYGLDRPAGDLGRNALGAYRRDLQGLVNADSDANTLAARTMLNEQNAARLAELREQGIWPQGLSANPTEAELRQFAADNSVLRVPADRVAEIRDSIRADIARWPDGIGKNYGFSGAPTEAELNSLLNRVQPGGLDSAGINRVLSGTPPQVPGVTGNPLPVNPVVPMGGGPALPDPSPLPADRQ